MRLVYQGSVKNLWEIDAATLEFEYTDAYSVFDWGRMPDALAHKGESLAQIAEFFFDQLSDSKAWDAKAPKISECFAGLSEEFRQTLRDELSRLCKEGLKHHFAGRSAPNKLRVLRVNAQAPEAHALENQTIYDYRAARVASSGAHLIPLEVVFRFGMPKGSSLAERLTPEYAAQLGLSRMPREGERFQAPVLEFFSKLEGTDRFLSWEQALNYTGLEFATFEKLVARSLLLAVFVSGEFSKVGLELWDGKFEWALIDGEIVLVDSIGPDELRLLDPKTGTQISKEFLRLFYRSTTWFEAIKDAKSAMAKDPSVDWKELVLKNHGPPPPLSDKFRETANLLYPSLAFALTGNNPSGRGLALDNALERIRRCQQP